MAVFSSSEQQRQESSNDDDDVAEEEEQDSRMEQPVVVVANGGMAEPQQQRREEERRALEEDEDDESSSSPSSRSPSPQQQHHRRPLPPPEQQQTPQPNTIPPMETVLYNLHCKCCHFALRKTNRWWRCRLEELLLVWSVCGFVALLQLHITFLHIVPRTCLPTIPNLSLHNNVETTHLILIDNDHHHHEDDDDNARGSFATSRPWMVAMPDNEGEGTSRSCGPVPGASWSNSAQRPLDECDDPTTTTTTNNNNIYFTYSKHPGWFLRQQHQRLHGGGNNNNNNNNDRHADDSSSSSSSSTSQQVRQQQQVLQQQQVQQQPPPPQQQQPEQYVYISKQDVQCFGEPFMQTLVFALLTPDTVMINWLIGAFGHEGGYVYNPRSGKEIALHDIHHHHHHHHHHQPHGRHHYTTTTGHDRRKRFPSSPSSSSSYWWFDYVWSSYHDDVLRWIARKGSIVVKTTFLFFVTTTLVSFTLRETQGRMLHFTHHLLQHVRSNRPVVNLVVKHVAENVVFVPIMVGIIFFLTEFYRDDKLLAFLVLTLLWICESFAVVSLRTVYGIQYFPRTFFLLFAAFHFYYFSYPHGFAYAALTTAILFMVHSMLFFWHRYELPAVCRGQVVQQQGHRRSQSSPSSSSPSSPAASPVRHHYRSSSSTTNTNTTTSHGDGMMMTMMRSSTTANSGSIGHHQHTDHSHNHNNDSSHDRSLLFGLYGEVIMRPSESFLNMQESALQAIVGAGTSSNDLRQPALFLS